VTGNREQVAHRVDAEHLELGGGLEVLLAAAFERVAPGGVLEIRTPSRAVALELPGWARLAGHDPIDQISRPDGHLVAIRRGTSSRILVEPLPPREAPPPLRDGALNTADWRGGALPSEPDPSVGFAPLGAVSETGAPTHHWRLSRRDATWPTTSASSSTKRPPSTGTPPTTSPGKPPRAWMTRPSAPSLRS
jgi:hypothetical protein